MTAFQRLKVATLAFLGRVNPDGPNVTVYENPSEEIQEGIRTGKRVKLFGRGSNPANMPGAGPDERMEENYLFATRRFPSNVTNVIGAGAVPGDAYPFFNTAIGGDGATQGFPTGFRLSELETNLDESNRITKGKNFLMREVGISFGASDLSGNIEQLLDAAALRFEKQGGQWAMKHGPINFWPGGMGVHGFSTNGATEAAHNGDASLLGVRKLRVPRLLKQGDNFDYKLIVPRATKAKDGTDIALTAFITPRVWLFGAQVDAIPN